MKSDKLRKKIRNDLLIYAMLLPVLLWYLTFCYKPMAGIVLAFKNYRFDGGIWGSPWIGMGNFVKMLSDKDFCWPLKIRW